MEDQAVQKPKAVKVIGVLLIVASVYSILVSFYAIASTENMDSSLLIFSPRTTVIMNLFGLVYYVALLVACVHFLKLKEWARNWIEISTWIYVIFSSVMSIYILWGKSSYIARALESAGLQLSQTLTTLFFGFVVSIIVFILAIACVILIYLRSKTVRNAMIN